MANHKRTAKQEAAAGARIARFLDDNAVHIYSTLAAVMFASNGVWFGIHYSWGVLDLVCAVLFFFLSLRESSEARSKLRKLAREKVEIEAKAGAKETSLGSYLTYLIELIYNNRLGFKATERISVLEYHEGGFALVARFSANPDFCIISKKKYPANYGVAGAALASENGEASDLKLPDPEKDMDAYIEYQHDKCNVPKSDVKKYKMLSRQYAAFTVKNRSNNQTSGIIVFESTRAGALDMEELRKAANSQEANDIGNLLGFIDMGA